MAMRRRGKVELKRIEDKSSRQVSFSKRRNGLFKKARELSVLCDAEIAVYVLSDGGRFYEFSTGNNRIPLDSTYSWTPADFSQIIGRYRRHADPQNNAQQHAPAAKIFFPESSSPNERNSLVHPVHGFLDGQIITQLNISDLVQLERQLSATLIQTREIKEKRLMEEVKQQHSTEIGAVSHEEERLTNMGLGLSSNYNQNEEVTDGVLR